MSDPKYISLPYIAQDQPDVYETSDLPESDQSLVTKPADDPAVERLAVDPKDAFQRFKYASLDPSRADFSDGVQRHAGGRGYGAQTEYELLAADERAQESPLQRLQRLRLEMQQLTEDVETIKKSKNLGTTPSDMIGQVEVLQRQLDKFVLEHNVGLESAAILSDPQAVQYKRLLEDLRSFKPSSEIKPSVQASAASAAGAAGKEQVVYELYYSPDVAQQTKAAKVAELEQRIHKLESLLGPQSPEKYALLARATGESSLTDSVAALSARLTLLNADEVDKIEVRLGLLDQSLTRTAEKKTTIDAQRMDKVAELYDMMKKWDGVVDVVPSLIDRLTVLQELHQHAMQFSASIAHLDSTQQEITKSLTYHQDLLKQVEQQFAKNITILENNCKTIDARLRSGVKK